MSESLCVCEREGLTTAENEVANAILICMRRAFQVWSHRMYSLISFRKSTHPQNCQPDILISNSRHEAAYEPLMREFMSPA